MKDSVDFPTSGAPISDSVIQGFIDDSEAEIETIYKTRFGNVEVSSTATSGAVGSLTDTTQSWSVDTYEGYVVWIFNGTGSGQYREIISNTVDTLSVSPDFGTVPDNTSQYRVLKLGYKDETVDGSGTDTQFSRYQPLVKLNELIVDSTSVTKFYTYESSGRIVLGNGLTSEATYFSDKYPQLVNMKYIYGVYPFPRIIKRLCVVLASIRTLVSQTAGTYDDFSTVSLPGGFSGSKGEPYVNIREAVVRLQKEADNIINSTYRPYFVVG